MGISNDIRAKKVYHLVSHPHGEKRHFEDKKPDQAPERDDDSDLENHSEKELGQMEDDFFNEPTDKKVSIKNTQKSSFSRVYKWTITLFILAIIGIAVYQNFDLILEKIGINRQSTSNSTKDTGNKDETYTSQSTSSSDMADTASSAASTTAPSTTAIDKSTITLSVLNGNGVKGSAQKIFDQLKTAGFSPTKVGNANSFSYTRNYIYYQTAKKAEADLVQSSLADLSPVLEASDAIAGKYNVVVVVGKN